MVAFLAYLPTTVFGEHFIYLIFFAFMAVRERQLIALDFKRTFDKKPVRMSFTAYLVLTAFALSLFNNLLNISYLNEVKDVVPYMLLMVTTMYLSKFLNGRDALILLVLLTLEIVVGMYEFTIGVNTIFADLENFRDQSNSDLLYFKRVFGLSLNSSALAEKILIGFFLLIGFNFMKKWWGKLLLAFLLIGTIITFSRTLITTGVVLAVLVYLNKLANRYKNPLEWAAILAGFLLVSFALVFFIAEYSEQIIAEFTRKQGEIELTGRGDIWQNFISFWIDHPVSGNGSYKLWLGKYHAHNSFLQTLASQGLFIFFILMIAVFRNIDSRNYWIIVPVFFYSLTQYGIFWGVSLFDLVFFHFLFHHYPVKEQSLRSSISLRPGLTQNS